MHCLIQEKNNVIPHTLGEPKEIQVTSFTWNSHGEKGKTYYYRMSDERYERTIHKAYQISLCQDVHQLENNASGNHEEKTCYAICTMHYYDFVDYDLEDCIGESKIDSLAKQMNCSSDKIWNLIKAEIKPLQDKILKEYQQTEEYLARKYHKEILQKYQEAKEDFRKEYGISADEYDRCYNVFGELMDSEYLNKLKQKLEERISIKKNSKNYRKQAYRESFNGYYQESSITDNFSEQEREILYKFYKILAKKYHPDSNPGIDTSTEMVLINKLKKAWRI